MTTLRDEPWLVLQTPSFLLQNKLLFNFHDNLTCFLKHLKTLDIITYKE